MIKIENKDIDDIWNSMKDHFNKIKLGLEAMKERKPELPTKYHQLLINEVIKKIYEEM